MTFTGKLGAGELGAFELAFVPGAVAPAVVTAGGDSGGGSGRNWASTRNHRREAAMRVARDDEDLLAILSTIWRRQ